MEKVIVILGVLLVGLLILAILPLGLIWSLNTLFGLGIAYTFKMWAAALVLLAVFPRSYSRSKD